MAKDAAGNLYIADAGNARIRKVNAAGVITTFAGTGTSGNTGDGGSALHADIDPSGGVGVDGAGNVYFAEVNNKDIRRIDVKGVISTFAPHLPDGPNGIFVRGEGNVYAAMPYLNQVLRISPGGSTVVVAGSGKAGHSGDGGQATEAKLKYPTGVWVDAHGNVFINDSGNNVIRQVDTMGIISTVAGNGTPGYNGDEKPATHARLSPQCGVVVDAAGEVFISDTYNNRIRMVDRCGIIHTVAGNGTQQFTAAPGPALDVGVNVPQYAWMDACGAMYFADNNAAVYRISR